MTDEKPDFVTMIRSMLYTIDRELKPAVLPNMGDVYVIPKYTKDHMVKCLQLMMNKVILDESKLAVQESDEV